MYHLAEHFFPNRSTIEENKSSSKVFNPALARKTPRKKSILMVVLFSFLDQKKKRLNEVSHKGGGPCVYIKRFASVPISLFECRSSVPFFPSSNKTGKNKTGKKKKKKKTSPENEVYGGSLWGRDSRSVFVGWNT